MRDRVLTPFASLHALTVGQTACLHVAMSGCGCHVTIFLGSPGLTGVTNRITTRKVCNFLLQVVCVRDEQLDRVRRDQLEANLHRVPRVEKLNEALGAGHDSLRVVGHESK